MAGADFIFNIAKGRTRTLAELTGNQGLLLVLLQDTGLDADSVLRDMDTLAVILGGNTECDFTNYSRKAIAGITVTVDDSADELVVDFDPITYTAAGGANNDVIAKAILCHDPDTTGGTDSSIIPIAGYDVDIQTDGNTIVINPNASGAYAAT